MIKEFTLLTFIKLKNAIADVRSNSIPVSPSSFRFAEAPPVPVPPAPTPPANSPPKLMPNVMLFDSSCNPCWVSLFSMLVRKLSTKFINALSSGR